MTCYLFYETYSSLYVCFIFKVMISWCSKKGAKQSKHRQGQFYQKRLSLQVQTWQFILSQIIKEQERVSRSWFGMCLQVKYKPPPKLVTSIIIIMNRRNYPKNLKSSYPLCLRLHLSQGSFSLCQQYLHRFNHDMWWQWWLWRCKWRRNALFR